MDFSNVRAAENPDSSMLSPLLTDNTLIRRPMKSAAVVVGDLVDIVPLR